MHASTPLQVKRLNLAPDLDQQRLAVAVTRLACRYFHPAFADAVLLHIGTLPVIETDANIVLKNRSVVKRTAWVDGQMIGQRRKLGGVGHGTVVVQSIEFDIKLEAN